MLFLLWTIEIDNGTFHCDESYIVVGVTQMELLIVVAILIVLVWLSFKLAGCLVGIIRIVAIIAIFWFLYEYVLKALL